MFGSGPGSGRSRTAPEGVSGEGLLCWDHAPAVSFQSVKQSLVLAASRLKRHCVKRDGPYQAQLGEKDDVRRDLAAPASDNSRRLTQRRPGEMKMRLVKYQVTNFRSVIDSGWIEAEQVTALIGVNESGKTNLLLPLWKFNPAEGGELRPNSDYPKTKYGAIREEPEAFTFVTAVFETGSHGAHLSGLCGIPAESLRHVQVARRYDSAYLVSFPDHTPKRTTVYADVRDILKAAFAELQGLTALGKEGTLKADAAAMLEAEAAAVAPDAEVAAPIIEAVVARIQTLTPASPAPTSSIAPRLLRLREDLVALAQSLKVPHPGTNKDARQYVVSNLPKFVYYSNYGNLDSEIYLPHVVEDLKRDDLGSKESAKARTLKVLFTFVRLPPADILELGRDFQSGPQGKKPTPEQIAEIADKKRTRTTLLHAAASDLTRRFREWWRQGDYTFDLQADGDHFRIWVSDARRPEKVELEDRSSGLQWFLSFYLVFLVESQDEHKDAILLLDEPGLSLHPLAQRDLSDFFENLSETNQILYTTHSPFLVDADMLERARKVYVADDGTTKASADLRRGFEDPRKSGATYAIYSALNMSVAESVLYGCHAVIVEGPSDQHYLSAIKTILVAAGRIKPARELVFTPAHGAGNAKVIAAILSGKDQGIPVALFDGDTAGRKVAQDLKNGLYQDAKDRVLSTNDFSDVSDSEVEDLFPSGFVAGVVDKWQRGPETAFSDVHDPAKAIVPQIEKWARTAAVTLEQGWKVDLARHVKKRLLEKGPTEVDDRILDRWVSLFGHFIA